MKKIISAAIIAASFSTASFAEEIQGFLEKGPTYSAIFEFSPESGDLIGYAFKNKTNTGKTILQNCLSDMLCRLGKSSSRPLDNTTGLKFESRPSGWYEITKASDVYMESTISEDDYEESLKTRYGVVSVDEEENFLLFNGKRIKPEIQGNASLSIAANYEIGKTDILLLRNIGGTACPALFQFVYISPNGIRSSPEFGTCSDIIYPKFDPKIGITISMADFEPIRKVIYRLTLDGSITEDGKPVR